MKRKILVQLPATAALLCALGMTASGQPRQAVCQFSFEACLSHAEGKNWKPVYDRCVKTRSACLGGMAYAPPIAASISTSIPVNSGSSSDPANADPATRAAQCENSQPRGTRDSCTLAQAGDGYGQNFSLAGPGVPMSRVQRVSSVVKCAGGALAQFYPNGRIESCTLDNSGAQGISLTDTAGKVMICAAHAIASFDPEGRLQSCN